MPSLYEQATALCNALTSEKIPNKSQAERAIVDAAGAALSLKRADYVAINPPAFVPISPSIFRPQGDYAQPQSLRGDWQAAYLPAFNAANSACTAAGVGGAVTYATTAAAFSALSARVATAKTAQAASPTMLAGLTTILANLVAAWNGGPPTQNDTTALAALQAAATTALTTAVADATAVATAYGIAPTL